MSNLIDIDLRGYEPWEDPEEPTPEPAESAELAESSAELEGIRPAGRRGSRRASWRTPPHPPGPVGLDIPRTRLWIKRPPGPAGLSRS